jgi:hypothetical protein
MPPTAGAMKIERGVVYNPTIHHGYFLLEKNRHPGRRQGHERRPLPPVPCKSSGGLRSILFILINILFILINPSCPRVLVSQHKQQSTIIWLGITRLGSARLGSARLGSARLGSARLGSARLGSARLGSARWRDAILNEQRVLPSCRVPQAQVS